jgi:hypothetical protein
MLHLETLEKSMLPEEPIDVAGFLKGYVCQLHNFYAILTAHSLLYSTKTQRPD